MTIEFVAVLILSIFFIFIGWRERYLDKIEDANKDKSVPVNFPRLREIVTSLFVVIGAGEYSFAVFSITEYGFIGPTFLLGLGVSLLLIGKYSPRIFDLIKSNESLSTIADGYTNFTTPDMFYAKHGKYNSALATLILVLAFTGLLILQHVLGGELLSIVTGMSYDFCVIFMGIVVCLYVVLGGFKALFHTDVYQGIFMWLALLILTIYIFFVHPQEVDYTIAVNDLLARTNNSIKNLSSDQFPIIFFLLTIIAAFGGPDLWQRVNMSSNANSAKKGAYFAALIMVLFCLPMFVIAIDITALKVSLEDDALINYVKQVNNSEGINWSLPIKAIFSLGLVAAFISTGDTAAMLISTSIQNELRRWNFIIQNSNDRNLSHKTTNILVAIFSLIAIVLAIKTPSIAEYFMKVLGILAVLGIPVYQILIKRGNKYSVGFGLLSGILIFLIQTYFLSESYSTGWWVFAPLLPTLPSFFIKAID